MKPGLRHDLVQLWRVTERARVEHKVGVFGCFRDGEGDVTCMEIHRLRTNQDDRGAMRGQGRKRIEKRRASLNNQVDVAIHGYSPPSIPVGTRLRPDSDRVRQANQPRPGLVQQS